MPKPNKDLEWLQQLKIKAEKLHGQEAAVTKQIREGFVERAIVFMDVVGSTAFKVENKSQPERWILRVRQFSELLAAAIRSCNGRVVKFIGDEVMGIFENPYDAQNLVGRVPEIEANLKAATGFETRIKVAVDFGPVFLLKFEGHSEPDPQGTPVDRCARIGKYGMAGEVLASQPFTEKTPTLRWEKLGAMELKGLGRQVIFKLGHATADLEPRTELPQKEEASSRPSEPGAIRARPLRTVHVPQGSQPRPGTRWRR
jgi:class 3 adenylate cyclase